MSYALAGGHGGGGHGGGHGGGGGHRGGGGGGGHRGGGFARGGRGGFVGGGWWGGADYGPGIVIVEPDANPCSRPDLYPTPIAAIHACAAYQASQQLVGMGDAAALYADFKAGSWKWALGGALAAVVLHKLL